MKHRILVVSSANIDFVQRMARLPRRGETTILILGLVIAPE